MRLGLPAVAALVLSGCAAPPQLPPAAAALPAPGADTCGAAAHADLQGRPATALEQVLILQPIRLIRPGTPVTEDTMPARLNIRIDAGGRIFALDCG